MTILLERMGKGHKKTCAAKKIIFFAMTFISDYKHNIIKADMLTDLYKSEKWQTSFS